MNGFLKIWSGKFKSKYTIGFAFLFLTMGSITAQNGFSFISGLGRYDLANIGTQWNFSERSSFEVNGGTNFGLNNKTLWSGGLSFNQVFLKPRDWKIKPGYSVGVTYWTQNDELYLFQSLSMPAKALLAYRISGNIQARVEGGIIFSTVLTSDRKQNVISGYPDRINFDFGIKFIYKLKRNEN
ncbi:MAG: hypothetical protein EP310_05490 [Bacteroidetes bacterium]|nr:MAG: hypothetical protein EP310_05490 [Bacteroidota bacterium]